MPNLVLLAGIPGVGKSTWAETFFGLKYSIISSDRIRKDLAGSLRSAHEKDVKPWDVFYREIELRLSHDVDVVADATFLTPRHRDRAREVAKRTNARLHFIIFKNWLVGHERNLARGPDAQVPDEAMGAMMALYWDTLDALGDEAYATVTRIEGFD